MGTYRIWNILKSIPMPVSVQINFQASYAKKELGSVNMLGGTFKKKKIGKLGATMEKKILPVELDAEKLVKYVCGANILKIGEDPPVKPESEYPEWLWNLNVFVPDLENLQGKEYWRRIRRMSMRRNNKFARLKRF